MAQQDNPITSSDIHYFKFYTQYGRIKTISDTSHVQLIEDRTKMIITKIIVENC